MGKIWFSSDHHFGHANVIKYSNRPFDSVEEMNEEMVRRWNERVSPDDTVFYLGDFSLSKGAVTAYLPRLLGHKVFVMGNHDWCHPVQHRRKPEREARFKALYTAGGVTAFCETEKVAITPYQIVNLCHFPYRNGGDHTPTERYTEYRPEDKGEWLLHGHVHDLWKVKGRMINVGVDVWDFYPVSVEEIAELIK